MSTDEIISRTRLLENDIKVRTRADSQQLYSN